jgi:hypothetical protein
MQSLSRGDSSARTANNKKQPFAEPLRPLDMNERTSNAVNA